MNCPLPRYWMCHIIVAIIIAAVVGTVLDPLAGATAGGFFYIGREYTQWESGLQFDWKGLLAPVATCLVMIIIIVAVRSL